MKTTKWRFTTKWLGLSPYDLALEQQMREWQNLADQNAAFEGTLLGCEHPKSITLGRRASTDEIHNTAADIPVFKVDRGGQATLHTPGQLVVYPIFALRETGLGVREFVRMLLGTTQDLLTEFGIKSENREDAGLYTNNGKICFVGLRVEKGITRHGLSLNVANDLGLFGGIRACGVESQQMDSFLNHDLKKTPEEIFRRWSEIFDSKLRDLSGAAPMTTS